MKNITLILLFACIVLTAFGQSTAPRFGSGIRDNTYKQMTLGYNNTPDVYKVGGDTIIVTPNALVTIVQPSTTVQDTICYKINVNTSYLGDELKFQFIGASDSTKAPTIRLLAYTGFAFGTSDSLIVLTNAHSQTPQRATIAFRFDGVLWQETESKLIK